MYVKNYKITLNNLVDCIAKHMVENLFKLKEYLI